MTRRRAACTRPSSSRRRRAARSDSISSGASRRSRFFGAEVRVGTALDPARDALLQTVEGFVASPPTKEEVERARAQLLKNIDLNLNRSDRIGLTLSEFIGAGDWRLYFLHRDRLRKVTVDEVQAAAAKYFKPANRTLGLFIPTPKPDRAEIPHDAGRCRAAQGLQGRSRRSPPAKLSIPRRQISRRVRTGTPHRPGLTLALLPKKTRGGTVVAQLMLRFGDEKSLMNRSSAASLAGAMLMRGTTKRTRQQIQDELDRLKARLNVSGGATQATVSIETTRESLPAVLRLAGEVLRDPSFPAE